MDTLANTPIFTEHLAFKADIQNDWTLCIKYPISELCRQLILLDAGSNYSVIRDFDADNWSCCTLDQITLQSEVWWCWSLGGWQPTDYSCGCSSNLSLLGKVCQVLAWLHCDDWSSRSPECGEIVEDGMLSGMYQCFYNSNKLYIQAL